MLKQYWKINTLILSPGRAAKREPQLFLRCNACLRAQWEHFQHFLWTDKFVLRLISFSCTVFQMDRFSETEPVPLGAQLSYTRPECKISVLYKEIAKHWDYKGSCTLTSLPVSNLDNCKGSNYPAEIVPVQGVKDYETWVWDMDKLIAGKLQK